MNDLQGATSPNSKQQTVKFTMSPPQFQLLAAQDLRNKKNICMTDREENTMEINTVAGEYAFLG